VGRHGEVAEWLKAPHSKCGIRATVSGVQIPPSPPFRLHNCLIYLDLLSSDDPPNCFSNCHRDRHQAFWARQKLARFTGLHAPSVGLIYQPKKGLLRQFESPAETAPWTAPCRAGSLHRRQPERSRYLLVRHPIMGFVAAAISLRATSADRISFWAPTAPPLARSTRSCPSPLSLPAVRWPCRLITTTCRERRASRLNRIRPCSACEAVRRRRDAPAPGLIPRRSRRPPMIQSDLEGLLEGHARIRRSGHGCAHRASTVPTPLATCRGTVLGHSNFHHCPAAPRRRRLTRVRPFGSPSQIPAHDARRRCVFKGIRRDGLRFCLPRD
jgi:hypothetical protein